MTYRDTYFPNLEIPTYLNHAAISPLNCRAREAMTQLVIEYEQRGLKAWTTGCNARNGLRKKLATMMGCNAGDIGLVGNTTHGLNLVALEFPWNPGDRLILVRGEFPGNIIPWRIAAQRYDLEILWLDVADLAEETEAFHAAMAREPRLLAVSWVQYQTGRALDIARLSGFRERFGLQICLDAIQGLGPLTLDLTKTPLDYLTAGGHKWLLAVEGTGFIYVNPQRIGELRPTITGWLSLEDPVSFLFDGAGKVDYEKPIRNDGERFEAGSMNQAGLAAMEASIGIFLEVGPEEVSKRVLSLAQRCREGLESLGISPADQGYGAGIVSFPMENHVLKETAGALDKQGVSVATPDGHLRAAPHFYNTEEDIDQYLACLAHLLP